MVWQRGLIVKPYSRRAGYEWQDTKYDREECRSQSTMNEEGRYTEDWIGTVAIDGSQTKSVREALGYWQWNCAGLFWPRRTTTAWRVWHSTSNIGMPNTKKVRGLDAKETCEGCNIWIKEN